MNMGSTLAQPPPQLEGKRPLLEGNTPIFTSRASLIRGQRYPWRGRFFWGQDLGYLFHDGDGWLPMDLRQSLRQGRGFTEEQRDRFVQDGSRDRPRDASTWLVVLVETTPFGCGSEKWKSTMATLVKGAQDENPRFAPALNNFEPYPFQGSVFENSPPFLA